jgi:acyl dehydratase
MSTGSTGCRAGRLRHFEDFVAGDVIELGRRTITKDAIIAFATEFDPQAFHVDERAAAQSVFGGLIASGWHTGSLTMRLFYDGVIKDTASLGSPGVDELRWVKPVRPGDTVSGRMTVLETVASRSKPDRGIVRSLLELRNQHGDVVLMMKGVNFISRRPPGLA